MFARSDIVTAFLTTAVGTAPSVAAGCRVIVKGHPARPLTEALMAKAIDDSAPRLASQRKKAPLEAARQF